MNRRRHSNDARAGRAGVTLVELLVVLAIMTIMTGVVGLAGQPRRHVDPDSASTRVAAARRTALASGRPVSITVVALGHARAVTALPNGAVIADSSLGVDQLSGVIGRQARATVQAHAP